MVRLFQPITIRDDSQLLLILNRHLEKPECQGGIRVSLFVAVTFSGTHRVNHLSFFNGKFGILTVIKEIRPDVFLCRCACGTEIELWRSQLAERIYMNCRKCVPVDGKMTRDNSCHARVYRGRKEKLKYLRTGEMQSYLAMIARCTCKTNSAYETYGGRGIHVCARWMSGSEGQGFKNFCIDMGPRPLGKTLDRINPQGHYEPANCRWADAEIQANNQRRYLFPEGSMPPVEDFRSMEQRLEEELHPYCAYRQTRG